MKVTDAIEAIVTSYGDIDLVARGMVVDAGDLQRLQPNPTQPKQSLWLC